MTSGWSSTAPCSTPRRSTGRSPERERSRRVRLGGHRRVLDAAADRRSTVGERRGVANLHPDPEAWTSGLLVGGVTEAEFGRYARRETGYRFRLVGERVTPLAGGDLPAEVVAPASAPRTDALPVPSYLRRCLAGARAWDDLDRLLASTWLVDGRSPESWLRG